MRGGFLHNEILVRPIERFFLSVGGLVCREYPAGNGFVDLFIQWESYRIVTEAELQWRRIGNDVVKATALHADLLLIVTPTWQTARLVRRKITLASNGPVI